MNIVFHDCFAEYGEPFPKSWGAFIDDDDDPVNVRLICTIFYEWWFFDNDVFIEVIILLFSQMC